MREHLRASGLFAAAVAVLAACAWQPLLLPAILALIIAALAYGLCYGIMNDDGGSSDCW